MQVNTDILTTIRAIRAHRDPILVYSGSGSLMPEDETPPALVTKGRVDALRDSPSDEPRRVATWGETTYHLQKSSLQNSLFVRDADLAGSAIYAFEQFVQKHGFDLPSTMKSWELITGDQNRELDKLQRSKVVTDGLKKSTVIETVEQIQHALAWEQNQLFIEIVYDNLPDSLTAEIPKAFWKQPDPVLKQHHSDDTAHSDKHNQTGLSDF